MPPKRPVTMERPRELNELTYSASVCRCTAIVSDVENPDAVPALSARKGDGTPATTRPSSSSTTPYVFAKPLSATMTLPIWPCAPTAS
jgi:hypothetical protein